MCLTRKVRVKFEVNEMRFCDVTCDINLHSVSDFYALLQYSFTRVTVASGGNSNFRQYQVKCYNFEPLVTSDTAESSSNLAHSEQFSKASSLRSFAF